MPHASTTAQHAVEIASCDNSAHAAFVLAGMMHPAPFCSLPEQWLQTPLQRLLQALSRLAISKPTSTRRSI